MNNLKLQLSDSEAKVKALEQERAEASAQPSRVNAPLLDEETGEGKGQATDERLSQAQREVERLKEALQSKESELKSVQVCGCSAPPPVLYVIPTPCILNAASTCAEGSSGCQGQVG